MNVSLPASLCRPVRFVTTASLVFFTLASAGCRAVVGAHGSDLASARTNADAIAMALEHRFTSVERAPKYANARMRIARYSLAPSKLVDDTALWTRAATAQAGAVRDLEIGAVFSGGRFQFTPRSTVALPSRVGDERHLIRLAHLGKDDWQWYTEVDHGVGTMPPQRMNAVANAIFASLERPSTEVRADYRSALPRTTKALGRLIVLDSLLTTTQSDGSTIVAAHLLVDGNRLRPTFPNFAKYIEKYVEPARSRFRLVDKSGAEWFDMNSANQRVVVRFRSHDGQLQPLAGGARRMPDTLTLHVDARVKFGMFTVGVSKMQGEFVHIDNPRDRSWAMRFQKEPEWHLPLIAERLLRSPLRRPFEGRGVYFKLGFRSAPSGHTLLSRTLDGTVRESAIMRFLGNLGFGAMSDFAGKVELEENRFISELFAALRADIRAL
jgi:hypothetical protein